MAISKRKLTPPSFAPPSPSLICCSSPGLSTSATLNLSSWAANIQVWLRKRRAERKCCFSHVVRTPRLCLVGRDHGEGGAYTTVPSDAPSSGGYQTQSVPYNPVCWVVRLWLSFESRYTSFARWRSPYTPFFTLHLTPSLPILPVRQPEVKVSESSRNTSSNAPPSYHAGGHAGGHAGNFNGKAGGEVSTGWGLKRAAASESTVIQCHVPCTSTTERALLSRRWFLALRTKNQAQGLTSSSLMFCEESASLGVSKFFFLLVFAFRASQFLIYLGHQSGFFFFARLIKHGRAHC